MALLSDKEQKKQFKVTASQNPDQYYPTDVFKKYGLMRKQCRITGMFFWTVNDDQDICGDPEAVGEFSFIGDSPAKKMSYAEIYRRFSQLMQGFGYTPIKRYPVVARWNPTVDYTIASIAAFQPYVVTGEVKPPADRLVIPQFCLRFGDIDNVGITGSHNTCFVMIGQHVFVPPKDWNQAALFEHLLTWFTDEEKGMGIALHELTLHEDAWAGGGTFGPCVEFFSCGVELGNQVYMMFEQTPDGPRELDIKVLDMGMGMERCAWFSQATPTIYDATFPTVLEKLSHAAKLRVDADLLTRFVPYGSQLNVDEVDDIHAAWQAIATKLDVSVSHLKETILPQAALYSIAEHSRALLVALTDGALPSNVGGGYNLRVLVRRCFSFIDQYGWNMYLPEICKWHAEELADIFPELGEQLDTVKEILDVEKEKYDSSRQKAHQIVTKLLEKDEPISTDTLFELYDSNGVSPELIAEEAKKLGKIVAIPDNFYARVSELHEKQEQVHQTKRTSGLDLGNVEGTDALYFDDWAVSEFDAKVVLADGKHVILDKTYFYPTSGGQVNDHGSIAGAAVVDVFKEGSAIIHVLKDDVSSHADLVAGNLVHCQIDMQRRKQLTQHHSAAHVINAAARTVLGDHANQAGAKKTIEKGHLDITHYRALTQEEIEAIEKESNRIISSAVETRLSFMPRDLAEKEYGMTIYQGGAIPGDLLRIVEIPGIDVECCGGTHVKNTSEIELIKIVKASKIADGVVRLTYVAGAAAEQMEKGADAVLDDLVSLLSVDAQYIPARAALLFQQWKKAKKLVGKKKQGKEISDEDLAFISSHDVTTSYDGNILQETARVLKTTPEHLVKTIERFKGELEKYKEQIEG